MKGYALWYSLAVLAFGAGCRGGDQKTGVIQLAAAPGPSDADSAVSSEPTDARMVRLEFTVTEIDVRVAALGTDGAGDQQEGSAGAGDSWVTIPGEQVIDLHAGSNEIALGAAAVPAGRITQIRLVIDGAVTFWNGTERTVMACPSCSTSGLKLAVEDVIVLAGSVVNLKLVFDLVMSSLETSDGLMLGPVMHVEASAQP